MGNEAGYQLTSSEQEGIVEIVLSGVITRDGVKKLQDEVITIVRKFNTRVLLVDIRALKGRLGFAEAYSRVRSYPADTRGIHTAVVDVPENEEYQAFHETTSFNAGRSLKAFTDIDAARAWLKSKQNSDTGEQFSSRRENSR
jgi:hypothetical protein